MKIHTRFSALVPIVAALLLLIQSASAAPWINTGSLTIARNSHTATLLANGQVLAVGGFDGSFVFASELFDPVTETWTTSGALHEARLSHTATLLANGQVLIAGGEGTSVTATTNAELYDPISGVFTVTGSMHNARENHTATRLPDGRVLVAAGFSSQGVTNTAEIYDPITGTWALTDPLPIAVYGHTATLLPNGKVLVAGGDAPRGITDRVALFDPALGTNGMWKRADRVAQVSQPAVSPISNRQTVASSFGLEHFQRVRRLGSTAIQQVGKPALRSNPTLSTVLPPTPYVFR
jgi:hypothetical protein